MTDENFIQVVIYSCLCCVWKYGDIISCGSHIGVLLSTIINRLVKQKMQIQSILYRRNNCFICCVDTELVM